MNRFPDLLAALSAEILAAPAGDLPAIIGQVEAVKAEAFARLVAPVAAPTGSPAALTDRFLSASEASQRMGVSLDWLYQNAGRLKFACRLGRRWKFAASGLEAWIRGERRPAGSN